MIMSNKKKKDPDLSIIGKKYGLLTVLSFQEYKVLNNGKRKAFYVCRCECGKFKITAGNYLKSGTVKTCGDTIHRRKDVMDLEDLVGQRFGRLIVIKFDSFREKIYKDRNRRYQQWLCKCDCGN